MRLIRLSEVTVIAGLWCATGQAQAETRLDFWHAYTHQPSGVTHYSFHLANYKRGLFFGSCGPSTRSLQWQYDIDLAGTGPLYGRDRITITAEGKPIELVSGTIEIDSKQERATIELRLRNEGSAASFIGNGVHRIKKLKSSN